MQHGAGTRCGILARVSTDRQEAENQLLQLREFAGKQGWEVVEEFVDTVTGSGKKTRPRFEAAMLAASQRRYDVLLFWALDRFSREGMIKTVSYLNQLNSWGVGWRSFTQPIFDSGNEMVTNIMLAVLAEMAKQERISISERTKAGLARVRKHGKRLGRPEATGKVSRWTEWRRKKAVAQ